MQFWTMEMEKQVGDRLQTLLRDPQLVQVYDRFGGEPFRRSSVFHGLAKFLTESGVRGRCCFEIGSWNGLTALVLSRFFDQVVTVDIAHNALKHEIVNHLGVSNIEFIDIRDNAHKAQVARRVDFDFAYLDGDHANDTAEDFALVRRCGRVLFHEAWPFQPPVWSLVNSMRMEHVTHNGMGLALWAGQ